MKTIFNLGFAAVILLGFTSCNGDDREDYAEITSVDKIRIDSVEIVSDTMNVMEVQSIRTYSTYGFGCQNFYDYLYERVDSTRNVTAYSFTHDGFCSQASHTEMSQFNFQPQTAGIYTFNFWQDENNSITKIIVVEP